MDKLTFKEWSILSDLQTIAPLGEDFEFSMARGELKTAQAAITRLMTKLKGEGDLEAWVQSKITKAAEYLDTVADHLSHGEDDTEKKKEVKEGFKGHKSVEEIAKKHKVSPSSIQKQLEMGMKVEHEHTTDNDEAMDIALQHLDEIPNYYSKLKKMEKVKEEWTELHDANGNTFAHVVDIIKGSDYKFKSFSQPINEDAVEELESGLKKLDDTSYDSIDKLMRNIMKEHDMTAKELHNAFVKKHDKTPDEWIKGLNEKCWDGYKQVGMKKKGKKVVPNCVKEESIDENKSGDSSLRDWFTKSRASDGTPGWVQLGGKYAGKPCAKQEGQTTKPKCGSSKMKADLSDKEEESAFRRKNQEDPNPDRKGKAKMVATEGRVAWDDKKNPNPSGYTPKEKSEAKRKQLGVDDPDTQSFEKGGPGEKEYARHGNLSAAQEKMKKRGNQPKGKKHEFKKNPFWKKTLGQTKRELMGTDVPKSKEKSYPSSVAKAETRKEEFLDVSEEKDACYSKVKSRYKVWPSAYASGALVKCRKVGAKNWGNKTKKESFELQEMGEVQRYCPKCKKNETMKECRYGEGYWKMFSLPASLAPDPYDPNDIHPANEGVSFDIGSGHKQAQKQAKIRNLATGTTNSNEKSAALRKLSGPSLPLADSVIQPGQLTNEDYQRIQSTGNVYTILFSWRGRPMMNLQLFFPNMKRPSKDEVKKEIEKFYPGAVIMQWYPSPTDPSKPIVVIPGK
jgi:hypothetical protein